MRVSAKCGGAPGKGKGECLHTNKEAAQRTVPGREQRQTLTGHNCLRCIVNREGVMCLMLLGKQRPTLLALGAVNAQGKHVCPDVRKASLYTLLCDLLAVLVQCWCLNIHFYLI